MIAYLFDIDGTLLRAGGAGVRALGAVMQARYGAADAARGINAAGRTDGWIVGEMIRAALGRAPEGGEIDAIVAAYLAELDAELDRRPTLTVLPDADRVLGWLGARPEVRLGVATGNVAAGARLKLARAGLDHHFGFGGYGCDSAVREELVACAIGRAGLAPGDTAVVVGDTVHDVAAARACGALCVAVTTAATPAPRSRRPAPTWSSTASGRSAPGTRPGSPEMNAGGGGCSRAMLTRVGSVLAVWMQWRRAHCDQRVSGGAASTRKTGSRPTRSSQNGLRR